MSLDRLLGTWDTTMRHSTVAEQVTGRQRYERVFDVQIDHAGWSMVRLDPEFSQRFTARFGGHGAMDTNGEYSDDVGATWQHDFTMSSTRVD